MLQEIIEVHSEDEFYIAQGFDDAIIGYDVESKKLVYSVTKVIDILISQDMNIENAWDHFDYNIIRSASERSPIWCYDNYTYPEL